MKKVLFKEKYNLMIHEVMKENTTLQKVEEFIAYFKKKVAEHPVATFIGTFDHYKHTMGLTDGDVDQTIMAAQHIIFCFGKDLPSPVVMGIRPRSIGISELKDRFVISFQEAPKALANDAMQSWIKALDSNK